MDFVDSLTQEISAKHLLKHPFYQDWNQGQLTKDQIQFYARQYYHHVAAFPRYLSATHAQCEDLRNRQFLLGNLVEEEMGEGNHPELWMRFAEGAGARREEVLEEKPLTSTKRLIDTFFQLCHSSYSEGLAALYAYEHQVPEISETKIKGLKKFYGISDDRSLEFFEVHLKADIVHREVGRRLLESLSKKDKAKASRAAHRAAEALWGFLDGVHLKAAA